MAYRLFRVRKTTRIHNANAHFRTATMVSRVLTFDMMIETGLCLLPLATLAALDVDAAPMGSYLVFIQETMGT